MERNEKPKIPRLTDRPGFCESCPLYRRGQECRLLRDLYDNNPTLFAERVRDWNKRAKTDSQSVVSECSKL